MTLALDQTHDPALTSWVAEANGHPEFPIQNLPVGVFRRRGTSDMPMGCVAIGDRVLDLEACVFHGVLSGAAEEAARGCIGPALNDFLGASPDLRRELRLGVSRLLAAGARAREELLVPMADAELFVPMAVGDYTDFYASVHHATNVGSLFRPDNPLLPNYKWLPIGYHGRASSIVPSGAPVRRPAGQRRHDPDAPPTLGPTRMLDYELEAGFIVGPGNALGVPIPIGQAEQHLAGLCLVNDWSARDIQSWEYQPLGPFLAKSFATTVSPWIVTPDALAPFRAPAFARPPGDPPPLAYLFDADDQAHGAVDAVLEVELTSAEMRSRGMAPLRISRSRLADLYWTPAQLVTSHTSGGCNLRSGDLLGSGTVSGPTKDSRGCLLELTWRGREPLHLPTGEERTFLLDGDEVTLRGWCEREGFARIGLGECRGRVAATALPPPPSA
ncbi:MAG TPA: fumarylacetoacetase [Gemmatimonadales bacterium]|nr:fumarylacetoacetase [Gemmatimonadales bacterium]